MKSSTLGDWTQRLRFIDWFGILMSILALIMCDSNSSLFISVNLGLGWTTSGEHQVIASPSGTFSNISSFTPWSSQSLSGFCRWYGTGRGFWATGSASGSISSLTSIFLPVFFSRKQPIPWNISLYSLSAASMLSSDVFTVLILSSLVSLSVPSGSILSIPSSNSVLLLRSGGESILPWITKNLLCVPRFLFRNVVVNSPLTFRSDWSVFSVSLLGSSSLISCDLCLRALNWYSSITFALAPLSGSTKASMSPMRISTVSWFGPDLIFFARCKCCAVSWR